MKYCVLNVVEALEILYVFGIGLVLAEKIGIVVIVMNMSSSMTKHNTIFYLSGFDFANIKDHLTKTTEVDDTFQWEYIKLGKNKIKLSIQSETNKQAYARGFWVRDKLGVDGGFSVREVNE